MAATTGLRRSPRSPVKEPNSTVWKMAPAGLPNVDVADLIYVPQTDSLYAATHGQGVWQLKVQ